MKYLYIFMIAFFASVGHRENIKNPTQFKTLSELHSQWDELLISYVTQAGNVDYKAFKKNKAKLDLYIKTLSNNPPQNSWSKADKLVYWINAYNALTIDLILKNYPIKSIKNIKKPWDQALWQIGEKTYSLNDIEHKILRKMNEPRIHFAIVCASESCPKLQNSAFIPSKLEQQLTKATKDFLSDPSKNKLSPDQLELSKIFKWFAKDFKTDGSLIDFINQYTEIEVSSKAKTSYLDYNWDLNE